MRRWATLPAEGFLGTVTSVPLAPGRKKITAGPPTPEPPSDQAAEGKQQCRMQDTISASPQTPANRDQTARRAHYKRSARQTHYKRTGVEGGVRQTHYKQTGVQGGVGQTHYKRSVRQTHYRQTSVPATTACYLRQPLHPRAPIQSTRHFRDTRTATANSRRLWKAPLGSWGDECAARPEALGLAPSAEGEEETTNFWKQQRRMQDTMSASPQTPARRDQHARRWSSSRSAARSAATCRARSSTATYAFSVISRARSSTSRVLPHACE